MENCSIGNRTTVKKALDELVSTGLLKVEARKASNGWQTSNMYTISFDPVTPEETKPPNEPNVEKIYELLKNSSSDTVEQILKLLENNSENDTAENMINSDASPEDIQNVSGGHEQNSKVEDVAEPPIPSAASPPTPTDDGTIAYGEYSNVIITGEEYNSLLVQYGQETVTDYIKRLDLHIASEGKKYKSHSATIRKWINKDIREGVSSADDTGKVQKRNKFANVAPRQRDFEEIAKMERQLLLNSLEPGEGG